MIMEIKLDEVKNILETEFFLLQNKKKFNFLPAEFCDWAIMCNMKITMTSIEKWEAFEYDELDFDEMDFWRLIFEYEGYSVDSKVLFISDESLIKKIAFSFKIGDFKNFVDYYEQTFKMDFFQPKDYIVYLGDSQEIKIIHHEGKLIKISRI
jgi:hypothetical protein